MAIVIRALILCQTDNAQDALQGAFSAINGGAFESANPIIDFALGVEQVVNIDPASYQDGEFVSQVPSARLLTTANEVSLPM
jgi:hypothetical protein